MDDLDRDCEVNGDKEYLYEQNLDSVTESLNNIHQNLISNDNHSNENEMLFEKITIEELIKWQNILKNTSTKEMDMVSMEYKNELLKLASVISDVLTIDE